MTSCRAIRLALHGHDPGHPNRLSYHSILPATAIHRTYRRDDCQCLQRTAQGRRQPIDRLDAIGHHAGNLARLQLERRKITS